MTVRRVQVGDPLSIRASDWNEIADRVNNRPIGQIGGRTYTDPNRGVWYARSSSTSFDAGSIVEIDAASYDLADDVGQAWTAPIVNVKAPTSSVGARWGVLIDEVLASSTDVARIVVAGTVQCLVDVVSTAHRYARPVTGDASKLQSTAGVGPAMLLYSPTATGEQQVWVRLDNTGESAPRDVDVAIQVVTNTCHEVVDGSITNVVEKTTIVIPGGVIGSRYCYRNPLNCCEADTSSGSDTGSDKGSDSGSKIDDPDNPTGLCGFHPEATLRYTISLGQPYCDTCSQAWWDSNGSGGSIPWYYASFSSVEVTYGGLASGPLGYDCVWTGYKTWCPTFADSNIGGQLYLELKTNQLPNPFGSESDYAIDVYKTDPLGGYQYTAVARYEGTIDWTTNTGTFTRVWNLSSACTFPTTVTVSSS